MTSAPAEDIKAIRKVLVSAASEMSLPRNNGDTASNNDMLFEWLKSQAVARFSAERERR